MERKLDGLTDRQRGGGRCLVLAAIIAFGALAGHERASAQEAITPVSANMDEAHAVAIQADGKVVVAGFAVLPADVDFAVVRYNGGDLSLDTSFDGDGILTTDIAGAADQAWGVAVQSDGKIVVVGDADTGGTVDFAVVRYNTDGSLDTSFDTDGIVTTALQSPDRGDVARAVAIQTDGKIVVAGYSERNPGNRDFALVRYNTDGSLDTTFDTDGIVTTQLLSPDKDDLALSVAIQADDKIVVAGYSDDGGDEDIAVARYNTDGSLDTTFDGDGVVTTDVSVTDIGRGVAIQSDGKIVVAGQIEGTLPDIGVVRYNANGSLDTSFDTDGIVMTDVTPGSNEVAHGVAIQPDGKIVVAGSHAFGLIRFMLARYNPDGSLDTTCDGDGVSIIDVGSDIFEDTAYAVALQGVDSIVAVGFDAPGTTNDFAAVRFDGTCTPTAVVLESFSARGGDGTADVTWKTASELNNLGFNLFRSTSEDGPYVKVNDSAIPGLGSSPVGAEYSYRDEGLTNGVTYYYQLEDIETTGRATFHGPIQATPSASPEIFAESSSKISSASKTLITYGNPENNRLRVLSRRPGEQIVELSTEGFYAEPQGDGTVRLVIPDFELSVDAVATSIPVRRSWVEVLAGRRVTISSVRELDVEFIGGLKPSSSPVPDVEAANGTVRARLRRNSSRTASRGGGLEPQDPARLVDVGFQQNVKKALVELAPLRWSGVTGELRLAKRLVVRLTAKGREPGEISLGGSRGRGGRRVRREGRSVKARLSTREPGLYEVLFEDVFRRGSVSIDRIRLSRQGRAVAFHVEPTGSSFVRGSRLYFVSEGAQSNPYGRQAIYELELGEGGLQMEMASASPISGSTGYYWHHVGREENRFYQPALTEAPDLWLWDLLFAPVTKSYAFEVSRAHSIGEPSRLSVWLSGTSDFPTSLDHHVQVHVNGSLVAEATWDGKEAKRIDAELSSGLLAEGANELAITNVGDTGATYSTVMLDRFAVDYPRETVTADGQLEGLFSESGAVTLSDLSAGPHLLDVTTEHPVWLAGLGADSKGAPTFRAQAGHRYLAVSSDRVLRPEIRRAIPDGVKDGNRGADYVVVGPARFIEEAEPLLQLRRSQGLRVLAVPVETIFDRFGFGEERPEAIKEFLRFAYHQWREPRLRYVLLLGDGTFDYKNYLGTGKVNHVPPLMVKTRFLWTASDPMLAAVNGDDDLPDIAIGRLPAANLEELRIMVEKILVYESTDFNLTSAPVLVADNPDAAGDFVGNADEISRDFLRERAVRKLYLSDVGVEAMRAGIRDAFDEGASVMSYVGHGGIHLWAHENVFNATEVPSLTHQPQQPFFITMNCLNGYFHFPYFDSLSETLVKADGKGAIAAFSPSGLSLNSPAHRFHRALFEAIFHERHERLGDVILAAQNNYAETGAFPELLLIYHLFGDPALTLKK